MLNYETILSSYDDKLTLMQWLKKVEAALQNASATSFEVVKRGNATLAFKITFADGTALQSGDIVLQQGESVQSGAIVNGHLILTLTNGDQLDCGSLFNGNLNISGNVTISGNISSGGKISAPEIVESMTGYSYETATPAGTTLTYNYIGAVKNGNKLTIVIDGKLTPTDTTPYNPNLGWFKMPPAVIAKLVPTDGVVAFGTIGFYATIGSSAPKQVGSQYYKSGLDSILIQLMSVNPNAGILTANTTYRFRIEQTFLLSENLAA